MHFDDDETDVLFQCKGNVPADAPQKVIKLRHVLHFLIKHNCSGFTFSQHKYKSNEAADGFVLQKLGDVCFRCAPKTEGKAINFLSWGKAIPLQQISSSDVVRVVFKLQYQVKTV